MLLIPYIIASNAGEAGIVIENNRIDANSLPVDIQDLLTYTNDTYNAILIEDPINLVSEPNGQVVRERKLVISRITQEKGSFVRVDDITTNIYVSHNIIPDINSTFEKQIIGDTTKAGFDKIIEIISYYNIPILVLSKIGFFAGGFLVVLTLTFLLYGKIELWNIPAMITCYSFQIFLANLIMGMNHLQVDSTSLLFGFLFMPGVFLIFKIKAFEETAEGRQKIHEIYKFNVNIFKKIIGKIT
jgi:hypothetical protein